MQEITIGTAVLKVMNNSNLPVRQLVALLNAGYLAAEYPEIDCPYRDGELRSLWMVGYHVGLEKISRDKLIQLD